MNEEAFEDVVFAKPKSTFNLDKSGYQRRWHLLLTSVFINTAAYYCFDHPTSLHNTLKQRFDGTEL
jgi:hypothetical protein